MKKITILLFVNFFVMAHIVVNTGCNKQDAAGDKNKISEVTQIEAGEKPYDKDAELLSTKYQKKSAIALAQLEKGMEFARKNGIETLIEILKNPADPRRGEFVKGDFYIWIIKTDFKTNALVIVHPINKAITGRDFFEIKDADGKMFIKDILRLMSYKDSAWVTYKWAHPRLKVAMDKLTYARRFNEYILNDGFYLKD